MTVLRSDAQSPTDTFPRNLPVDGEVANYMLPTCYGLVTGKLRGNWCNEFRRWPSAAACSDVPTEICRCWRMPYLERQLSHLVGDALLHRQPMQFLQQRQLDRVLRGTSSGRDDVCSLFTNVSLYRHNSLKKQAGRRLVRSLPDNMRHRCFLAFICLCRHK